jgi:DNA-binding CsgD family transcriptional regulator
LTFSPRVQQTLRNIGRGAGLTPVSEIRLLEIAEGLTYEQIARKHALSVNTVKTEVGLVLRSLRVRCRHQIEEAVRAAQLRVEAGATAEELDRFLRLRFE